MPSLPREDKICCGLSCRRLAIKIQTVAILYIQLDIF